MDDFEGRLFEDVVAFLRSRGETPELAIVAAFCGLYPIGEVCLNELLHRWKREQRGITSRVVRQGRWHVPCWRVLENTTPLF